MRCAALRTTAAPLDRIYEFHFHTDLPIARRICVFYSLEQIRAVNMPEQRDAAPYNFLRPAPRITAAASDNEAPRAKGTAGPNPLQRKPAIIEAGRSAAPLIVE